MSHGHPDRESITEVARDVPVEMVMEKEVLTVDPDTSAAQAAKLLVAHKFGCLPVVEKGKLIGIVTEADFVRRFAQRYFEWEMRGVVAMKLAVFDSHRYDRESFDETNVAYHHQGSRHRRRR